MDTILQGGFRHIEKYNKANTIDTKDYWNLVKNKRYDITQNGTYKY